MTMQKQANRIIWECTQCDKTPVNGVCPYNSEHKVRVVTVQTRIESTVQVKEIVPVGGLSIPENEFYIPTAEEWLDQGIPVTKSIMSSGLLARKNLTIYGAIDDSYKSWLLCQLAVCLASGTDWLCFSTQKCGTIVYLVMEGSMEYLLERMENITESFGLDWSEIQKRIRIVEYLQESLDNKETATKLYDSLKKVNPDVVILDPITYMIAGDTRYSPVMVTVGNNLLQIARGLNCAVLAVMHCRKQTKNNDNMADIIGSGQLKNMAATRIKLFRGTGSDEYKVWFYAHTRYSERPKALELVHNGVSFNVLETQLKPREAAREAIIEILLKRNDQPVTTLAQAAAKMVGCDQKTARGAITDLEVKDIVELRKKGKGSAAKLAHLTRQDIIPRTAEKIAEKIQVEKSSLKIKGD